MLVNFDNQRPRGSIRSRLLRFAVFIALVGVLMGGLVGVVAYGYFGQSLPDFDGLEDYRPKTVSRVYGQEGQLIGEFYREKRIVLPYDRIPPKVVQAFMASEDNRFFDHSGIDYWGLTRAAVANFRAGRVVQGGSTITQQVAKSLLISAEGYKQGTAKNVFRKVKEAILARRLEANLSKQDILSLYLNQIFLGNQSYGIQAAAENYFRKNVEDLNVAEIALLAGLPQAPSRYSPFRHPKAARDRREYVLRRMREEEIITDEELEEAKNLPIEVFPAPNLIREITPYFTEQVRRILFERFDEKTILEEGLKVYTTVDVERYRAAEDASYEKLRMVDKRQGYRGPLKRLGKDRKAVNDFLARYTEELRYLKRYVSLAEGELYVGVVVRIDRKNKNIYLKIGPHDAVLPLAAMRWAREVKPTQSFLDGLLKKLPSSIEKGDVLLVRTTTLDKIKEIVGKRAPVLRTIPKKPNLRLVALEQEPNLETALLSVEAKSGYVLAMLGGYAFDRSEFNRALQACRQPGSSFKPLVYAAALDLKDWTASKTVLDAPLAFNDPTSGKRWKPNNFGARFLGDVTLRQSLQKSMNVPSIRTLSAVGLKTAIKYAKRLGIRAGTPESPCKALREELGLALGSSAVTMEDLVRVYQLFANYGQRVPQRFITRIEDRDGRVLFDDGHYGDPWQGMDRKVERALRWTDKPAEQVISPQVAFLITKMMRNVVEGGTGRPARKVDVPVAGKTGTTNDSFDAWFVGFTTDLVTAAWVGYDDYDLPMGRYEQGGRAALPVWVAYMTQAIKKETDEFDAPPGIIFVDIDPKTGLRAWPETEGAVSEAYRKGTEPTEYVDQAGQQKSDDFFMLDN